MQEQTEVEQHRSIQTNRRLQRAAAYVDKHWLPVNEVVLSKVRDGIDTGAYDLASDFLIEDLRSDIGLFLTCYKSLIRAIKADVGYVPVVDPIELMRVAGPERLKNVLSQQELSSSPHSIERQSEDQIGRLREALISASAVEELARGKKLNAHTGFSIALLRQLGLLLIAWNYPTVYKAALDFSRNGGSYEEQLAEALGFTPTELVLTLMNRWGMGEGLEHIFKQSQSEQYEGEEVSETPESYAVYAHVCTVGEALARACQGNQYPTAATDWEWARDTITDTLGNTGLLTLQKKVEEYSSAYKSLDPERFRSFHVLCPHTAPKALENENPETENGIIQQCPQKVRLLLRELYANKRANGIDQDALTFLIRRIIPAAGFSAGTIYIMDATGKKLLPRAQISKNALFSSEAVTIANTALDTSPIQAAYQCNTPILESILTSENGYVSYVCGVLGDKHKTGVLYLERSNSAFDASGQELLFSFRAIRQALADILGLI